MARGWLRWDWVKLRPRDETLDADEGVLAWDPRGTRSDTERALK